MTGQRQAAALGRAHGAHGGGEQRGAADDLAALVNSGLDEGLGSNVGAQVHNLKALALHHHLHQVLADVVQVALDGADDGSTQRDALARS